jgi:hypothetical protein
VMVWKTVNTKRTFLESSTQNKTSSIYFMNWPFCMAPPGTMVSLHGAPPLDAVVFSYVARWAHIWYVWRCASRVCLDRERQPNLALFFRFPTRSSRRCPLSLSPSPPLHRPTYVALSLSLHQLATETLSITAKIAPSFHGRSDGGGRRSSTLRGPTSQAGAAVAGLPRSSCRHQPPPEAPKVSSLSISCHFSCIDYFC